jgi:hypothetical protein
MTPLITFYKQLLESLDCVIDKDDNVSYNPGSEKEIIPVMISFSGKEKRLVLPTKKKLKEGGWTEYVGFHPLCESVFSGQSEVLNLLVKLASIKLHDYIQKLAATIISLGLDTESHGKLTLKQKELLSEFGTIDTSVSKLAIAIAKKNTGVTGKYPLLTLRLERGGVIDDEVYSRTCTLIPYILKSKEGFCGVKEGSINSKEVITQIYNRLLPKIYSVGSNANTAPYFIALLKCFYQVISHLNNVKSILGKHSPAVEVNLEWFSSVTELAKYYKQYLPQVLTGNTGVSLNEKKENEVDEVKPDESVSKSVYSLSLDTDPSQKAAFINKQQREQLPIKEVQQSLQNKAEVENLLRNVLNPQGYNQGYQQDIRHSYDRRTNSPPSANVNFLNNINRYR